MSQRRDTCSGMGQGGHRDESETGQGRHRGGSERGLPCWRGRWPARCSAQFRSQTHYDLQSWC